MILAQSEGMGAATKELLNYGVLGAIVVIGLATFATMALFLWRWASPRVDRVIDVHLKAVESNTENFRTLASNSERQTTLMGGHRKALGYFGEAIVEAAPNEKQPAVRNHIQRAHDALNDDR